MVWHAFGFPDRHCRGLVRVFFRAGVLVCGSDASGLRRRLLGGGVGGSGVCWWFENWIVDASKKEFFLVSVDFEWTPRFVSWVFVRSFCDHFDMLC